MWLQRTRSLFSEGVRRGKDIDYNDVDIPGNRSWYPFQLAFILRSRSRYRRLLLADFAPAGSLFSSWTIPIRADAHDALSSKRRSTSSLRARTSSKLNLLAPRRIRPPHPSHLPVISSSRQSQPLREKGNASKEHNRDTRVTSDLPFLSTRSTRPGSIPGQLVLIAAVTSR